MQTNITTVRTETAASVPFKFYDHVLEYTLRTGITPDMIKVWTPSTIKVWQILAPARTNVEGGAR